MKILKLKSPRFPKILSSYSKKNALVVHNIELEPNGDLMSQSNPNLKYYSSRALFLSRNNDILMLNFEMPKEYLEYVSNLGFEIPTIINVESEKGNNFVEQVESFQKENKLILNKKNYFYSPFYVNKKDYLLSKKFGSRFMGSKKFEIYDFVYNKYNFTKLCQNNGIPSLESMKYLVSSSSVEKIKSDLLSFFDLFNTETLLLRETNGAGGIGIYALTKENIDDVSKSLLKYPGLEYLVQIKYDILSSPSVIGVITAKKVKLFSQTEQLFNDEGKYLGNIINLENFNDELKNLTLNIGEIKRNFGYRGVFGIDFIETNKNEFYPVEDNARFTNSMTLYNILAQLNEDNVNFTFGISTVMKVNPASFEKFKERYENVLNIESMNLKLKTVITNPILIESGDLHISIVGEKNYVLEHLNYLLEELK